jgi:hypothetical protein
MLAVGLALVPTSAQAAIPGCLNGEIVDIAATNSGNGYWLVGSDGGVFTYGDAPFFGSMGGKPLNKPVVAMAPTASGNGYWLVAADGGVFAFGDAVAPSNNPLPATKLNQPVVEATRTSGNGLALVAGDGGVFTLGGARFLGSMGGKPLNKPMVDIAATPSGNGYWLIAADGGSSPSAMPPHRGTTHCRVPIWPPRSWRVRVPAPQAFSSPRVMGVSSPSAAPNSRARSRAHGLPSPCRASR